MTMIITSSLFSGGGNVQAADNSLKEFTLDPMMVTSQRVEKSDLNTPAATTIITAKDLEITGAKTAYDAIERNVVGVTNNAYGPGGREYGGSTSRTVIRGLDKGTLVLVNGAPINMLNYNSMEGIPVESIDHIEVVKGANSVLYGSEAFGGVINIITKKGGEPKTTISTSYGNYDKKWAVSSTGDKYSVCFSKDYYGEVDKTNKVFAKSTSLWRFGTSHKNNAFLSYAINSKLSVNYAHTEGVFTRDSLTVKNGELTGAGTSYYYDDTKDNISLTYDDKEAKLKSVLSYNRRIVDPESANISGGLIGLYKSATSSNWKMDTMTFDTQKGWEFRDGKDSLITGLTLGKENMNDRGKARTADRKNIALYASYDYKFNNNFDAILGLRGQHISDYAKDQNILLPQVQTLYKINENTSWYVNIGKSFQMPALNTYFQDGSTEELKPQKGWTYETGVKLINDKDAYKLGVFHMDIDAKFEWIDLGLPLKVLKNVGKFKNTGVEAEYTHKFDQNWKYNLGASISNPQTKDYGSEEWIQSDAKLQLTAGVQYAAKKLSSSLSYLFLGNRENSYYNNLGTKYTESTGNGHKVSNRNSLNANFNYKADSHNAFNLSLNNIFDTEDTINKYENWNMPFNWMLTYSYSF